MYTKLLLTIKEAKREYRNGNITSDEVKSVVESVMSEIKKMDEKNLDEILSNELKSSFHKIISAS